MIQYIIIAIILRHASRMPPFVSTAPSNKHESVKTINVQVARSLRNAKRIKKKEATQRKE